MDQNKKLDRREFFTKAAAAGAAVTGAAVILSACKGDAAQGGGAAAGGAAAGGAAAAADCSDVSKLTDAEKGLRTSLKYVDNTEKPGQNCGNCKLFEKKAPCNGCSVVKGPIAENGWCVSWAAKG